MESLIVLMEVMRKIVVSILENPSVGLDFNSCFIPVSIAPLVEHLTKPKPLIPHRPQFYHEGFAVFSEKGQTGKLCAEGMESNSFVRSTVAESLCKALGYE